MDGGMHGRGHAWQGGCGRGHAWQGGMCGRGDVHGRGVWMAGGHTWQEGMHGGGHAWQGECAWQGVCMPHMPPCEQND